VEGLLEEDELKKAVFPASVRNRFGVPPESVNRQEKRRERGGGKKRGKRRDMPIIYLEING